MWRGDVQVHGARNTCAEALHPGLLSAPATGFVFFSIMMWGILVRSLLHIVRPSEYGLRPSEKTIFYKACFITH